MALYYTLRNEQGVLSTTTANEVIKSPLKVNIGDYYYQTNGDYHALSTDKIKISLDKDDNGVIKSVEHVQLPGEDTEESRIYHIYKTNESTYTDNEF